MTFSEALEAMKAGKRVKRKGWGSGSFVDNSRGGVTHLAKCEFLADDWEIVPPPPLTIENMRLAILAIAKLACQPGTPYTGEVLDAIEKLRRPTDPQ